MLDQSIYYVRTTLESALPLAIAFLGVYIVFRLLDDFDLTVEGAFPLGAAVTAVAIHGGLHPLVALFLAMGAGAIAGMVTALIHTRLHVSLLLSGILTMTALFTVNLRIMGRPNIPLIRQDTLFSGLNQLSSGAESFFTILAFTAIAALVYGGLIYFLLTEFGLTLRATGVNRAMARSVGVSTDFVVLVALMISNSMSSLAGSIAAQDQGFADVQMGLGLIVAGVASILIGGIVVPRSNRVIRGVISVLIGTTLYRLVLVVALRFGLQPFDLKLFTALILIVALAGSRAAKVLQGKGWRLGRLGREEATPLLDETSEDKDTERAAP